MNSELFLKDIQREEGVDRIKAFLVYSVAALYLAIMSGRVRTDQLMLDAQPGGGFLEKGSGYPVYWRGTAFTSTWILSPGRAICW